MDEGVLVNNAGLASPMLHFLTPTRRGGANVRGHFLCCHRAAHHGKAGWRLHHQYELRRATRIHRSFTAYDASKGGIEALTRAMALDLGPYGIRVNAHARIDVPLA